MCDTVFQHGKCLDVFAPYFIGNTDNCTFAVPREYEFRDLLPKTLVGKVAYNELVR